MQERKMTMAASVGAEDRGTMRIGSTAQVLAECMLYPYKIS